ncbi:MAG: YidC/Oxa1 family membrane protein insertase [Chloroflexota bacterium]
MGIWQDFINLIVSFLVYLNALVGNYGLAIVTLTVIIRLIFLPLSVSSSRSMKQMAEGQARIKPHMDALKKKYPNDRQKLLEEQQKLYKEHNINPMAGLGGCLPMLVQMPLWIALYSALLTLAADPNYAAAFLWIPNLADRETAPYLLTAFTGISQYAVAKMAATPAADAQAKTMNQMMQLTMPLMMVVFAFQVPAGLVLYWATTNIFQFFQQLFTTGWGDLWPSRAKARPALATMNGKASSQVEAPVQVETAVVAAPRPENGGRNGRTGANAAPVEQVVLSEQTPSTMKNGLRIYTLEPETDGGGDYTAEEASSDMDESIARARGQTRSKRKRRK